MEIKRLLEKYYRGETSLQEEYSIRQYFETEEVSPELEPEKEMFRHFSSLGSVPEPSADLEERIMAALGADHPENRSVSHKRYGIVALLGIAAGLMLFIVTYFYMSRSASPADTFKDPTEAYNATIRILYNVSSRLNDGTHQLSKAVAAGNNALAQLSSFAATESIVNSNLGRLDYLQRAINIADSSYKYVINK